MVKASSRYGEIPRGKIHVTDKSSSSLVFTTFHFPETAAINKLTINAVDPRSAAAEFEARAITIEKV